MKNKDKIKRKAGVVLVVSLMIVISVGSVLGGTVTITDETMATTDSSLEINYADGWIRADNATVDNQSLTATEFNEWNLAYAHIGDPFFNASDAEGFTWEMTAGWNNTVEDGDPFFNASASYGITATNIIEWALSYNWIGDQFFNASDAEGFTWEMAAGWNDTSGAQKAPSNTLIVNSNNNSWAVTEGNLELAINDVGTHGRVSIGSDITITSEIDMDGHDGVFLDFNHHTATVSGDISFINFTDCNFAGLINVDIRVSTQTGSIIMVYSETDANRVDYLTINNVNIQNTGGTYGSGPWSYTEHNFTGIELFADAVGGTGRVFEADIRNVIIEGADVGILIKTRGDGYVNGCDFYHVYAEQPVTGVEFIESTSTNGANGNSWYSFRTQTATYSEYGIKNVQGKSNSFDCMIWDWAAADSPVYTFWIGTGSVNADIRNTIFEVVMTVLDNGLGSDIVVGHEKYHYDSNYDYKVTTNTTHYFTRLGEFGDMPVSGSYDKNTDFQALMSNILAHDDIVVKLDSGVYYPDTYIPFGGKNITIEGTGDHTTIIRCESGSAYASGLFALTDESDSNATFRNIVFDGTGASDTSVGVYFSTNDPIHGLTIDNCIFLNWDAGTSRAVRISPGSDDIAQNIQITNCEFYDCDYGVSLDGDDDPSLVQYVDVSHNYFQECQFSIFCDWVRNSTISNNRIISTVASSDGITLTDSIDIVVEGNNVNVVDDGIIETGSADYNTIFSNIIHRSGDPLTTVGSNTASVLALATSINQWNLAYTHIGDPWFNASDASGFTWEMATGWNNTVEDGDPFFNASASHGITATNIIEWALAYNWIGDQFFNASDAEGFTWEMTAGWNTTSNIFDQELNQSDDIVFNKVSTPNIDTASGGLNITSDDSYTRVTGDLNVTGTLSPTLFLIPCYGELPAAVEGMFYFNTGNYSLSTYYDGAEHWHEED